MAEFTPKKIVLGDINNGIEFTESDGVTPNAINDPIEAVAYAQTVVEHLTDTPDTSEIVGVGSPNVSFVSSTTADGVTIYKFKFTNLSGATFTPSLDEAGNLSWSNNRNLPNPPTINIKGDGLEIKKWYDSTEAMNADYSNPDIAIGDAVAISGTLDLYVKGASAFESTGTLKGDGLDEIVDGTLTAKKAEQDADGNSFSTSYAKKADLASGFAIGTQFDGQNITANCTLIRCSGDIVIASGVTVNAIDCPNLTTSGDGTINKYIYENEVQEDIENALVPISSAIGERLTIKSVDLGVVELTPNEYTQKYFSDITADGFIPSDIMFLEYLPFQTTDSWAGNNSIVCCKYSGRGFTSRVVCNYGVNGDKVGALSVQTTPTYVRIYNYTGNIMYAIRLYFLGRYNNDNQSSNS